MQEIIKRDKDRYSNIRNIFLENTGRTLRERRGASFRFPMYIDERLEKTDITLLSLSVRSENCLRRAGISTIGDLCSNIRSSGDLKKLRNCGNNSAAEIMDHLFAYQYMILGPTGRESFLVKVVEINQ